MIGGWRVGMWRDVLDRTECCSTVHQQRRSEQNDCESLGEEPGMHFLLAFVVHRAWTLLRNVSNHICFLLLASSNNFFYLSNCLLFCILCTVINCTVLLAQFLCKHFLYWLIHWLIEAMRWCSLTTDVIALILRVYCILCWNAWENAMGIQFPVIFVGSFLCTLPFEFWFFRWPEVVIFHYPCWLLW